MWRLNLWVETFGYSGGRPDIWGPEEISCKELNQVVTESKGIREIGLMVPRCIQMGLVVLATGSDRIQILASARDIRETFGHRNE